MREYAFVYDPRTGTFPVRYWVDDGSGPPPDSGRLMGPIPARRIDAWVEEQRAGAWPEPPYAVATMIATSWEAVADNFPGLYFH